MSAPVHFLGLEVTHTDVRTALLGRDGTLVAAQTAPLCPDGEDERGCTFLPSRWARQVADAVRELVESSGMPTARIWGCAPVAPSGWICLDAEYKPMTELHVAKPGGERHGVDDVAAFLAEDPRRRSRIALLFAPKDFLRFHWSRVIATDVTDAMGFGLLTESGTDWDREKLARSELDPQWLPPVFPSTFACGRVGPEGMDAMGLHSSSWIAAGSTTGLARTAACGFLDEPAVYLSAEEPLVGLWHGSPPEHGGGIPWISGTTRIHGAPRDRLPPDVFTEATPIILDWRAGEDPEPLIQWARDSGRPIFTAPYAGAASPGAAILALLASGAYTKPASFYRRHARPQPYLT